MIHRLDRSQRAAGDLEQLGRRHQDPRHRARHATALRALRRPAPPTPDAHYLTARAAHRVAKIVAKAGGA